MLNVTVDEIQKDPLRYLQQVEAGETLIILRSDKPIAEVKPIVRTKQLRPFGLCAGEFTVPDDFDAPLPEDLLSADATVRTYSVSVM
jgi:antitoxin (DNA-binding transcriptional repressor) of toxin-antitoxin stability system